MDLMGKQVVIIGLARSGLAAAQLVSREGAGVLLNDRKPVAEMAAELQKHNIEVPHLVGGGHPAEMITPDVALVIKNPGVPMDLEPIQKALELGIPVVTEVEVAAGFLSVPMVAITGTNGKTTTTALTGEIFQAAGKKTAVAGNIGLPLSAVAVEDTKYEAVVAELSSFQLEATIDFRPQISAILNLTPDHMDRHKTMEAYVEAKEKIFANQKASDVTVLNADDPRTYALRGRPRCRVYLFSRRRQVERGAFVRNGHVVVRDGENEETVCGVDEIRIPGAHNLENALAAALLAWLGGVAVEVIAKTLKNFPGVSHRLEHVREFGGVTYINDSKGTNSDAAIKALEAFAAPKLLIAGGYDKGGDFSSFAAAIKKHARYVVLLGEVAGRLAQALDEVDYHAYSTADSLEDAVKIASDTAQSGEVVLLSPGCASWDMFEDFEQRGNTFKEAVWELGRA
ncbi:UDP-N-acetylmuramoyl-L-alanine--D-glutamate ligase [Dethiobacter alkaliphilus]|uniref:UDP-N-acetylmuramoylalanine--D-glutamate ligase n=1 Tax=Dethiobacter alkaliphilus AHT 1 TaxID=555088 RepID=C0GFT9_DETAL|nr:UDP-N-acetylmuramoyl-L-alanine--D-glutamate ligase [Dethiobacter alkaliphilus]EEG77628.1 UDP-N-acetylmuramoylalanine/D-glutamate ligase [Dethiobacter alkaliphilus AHT 1]